MLRTERHGAFGRHVEICVRSYPMSPISLGRRVGCVPEPRERWGAGTHLPSHSHTQPEVRGQRRVENLDCRAQT